MDYFFIVSNNYNDTYKINGAILTPSVILKNAMTLASEAEVGAIFHNTQEAEPTRTTLGEMNHTKPATPIQTDKPTSYGKSNIAVQIKRSKSTDMRFHWETNRVRQFFYVFWKPGATNYGNYMKKHHLPHHHRRMIPL